MPTTNLNCWEMKGCPEDRRKTCPAFIDGAGKRCWLVTGTMCGGVEQGDMKAKVTKCRECSFFKARSGLAE